MKEVGASQIVQEFPPDLYVEFELQLTLETMLESEGARDEWLTK